MSSTPPPPGSEPSEAPTQHAEVPSEPPESGRPLGGVQRPQPLATLPLPGNAELPIYLLAVALVGIVALISDDVDAGDWVFAIVFLTAAYVLSRGIAKASRVFEY